MMAVKYEARPASAEPEACRAPAMDRRALSADSEPRTLAARKAYPEPCGEAVDTDAETEAPLDLSTHARKEISVRDFARHSFADPADYVRAQVILRQSRGYLAAAAAAARDSGTESDDSAERLSPGDDAMTGKAYKKSLMKRYNNLIFTAGRASVALNTRGERNVTKYLCQCRCEKKLSKREPDGQIPRPRRMRYDAGALRARKQTNTTNIPATSSDRCGARGLLFIISAPAQATAVLRSA
ncbi:hypothetical protein RR48_04895 [Papilio machaon]|uniref:Uncharacterized protein n=1 Tax=Papilio machaon TaxID=76193 RepID=A0A0N0PF32_PAPMA|nr:hypothetical protein RR48_04895 [Papilio machaon]